MPVPTGCCRRPRNAPDQGDPAPAREPPVEARREGVVNASLPEPAPLVPGGSSSDARGAPPVTPPGGGPQTRSCRRLLASQKGSGGGQCPGGGSPGQAGDSRRVPGCREQSVPGGRTRWEGGKERSEAARSLRDPRSAQGCLPGPERPPFPAGAPWAVQVRPSKARAVLSFPVLSRRGRLGRAKTVRTHFLGVRRRPQPVTGELTGGGLCLGGCPPSPAGTTAPSRSPLLGAWATPASVAPCQRGPGAPAHWETGPPLPPAEKGENGTDRGRTDRGGWTKGG